MPVWARAAARCVVQAWSIASRLYSRSGGTRLLPRPPRRSLCSPDSGRAISCSGQTCDFHFSVSGEGPNQETAQAFGSSRRYKSTVRPRVAEAATNSVFGTDTIKGEREIRGHCENKTVRRKHRKKRRELVHLGLSASPALPSFFYRARVRRSWRSVAYGLS